MEAVKSKALLEIEAQAAALAELPNYMDALNQLEQHKEINSQEVSLVILKDKAILDPITGEDEMHLKSGNFTLSTFIKKFNEVLFEKTKFAKTKIKDFPEFLSKLTPQDKSLLVYALSLSSFDNLGTIGTVCEHCEEKTPVDIKPAELWHSDSAPKIWDLSKDPFAYKNIQTFLDGNLEFEITLPTEDYRLKIMDIMDKRNELKDGSFGIIESISFLTTKITVKGKEDKVLTDLESEILPFLQNLPLKIKDIVLAEVDLTIFDKYMPNFYQEAPCTKCHKINKVSVNIESTFFRKSLLLLAKV